MAGPYRALGMMTGLVGAASAGIAVSSHPDMGKIKNKVGNWMYRNVFFTFISMTDAEWAHNQTIKYVKSGMAPIDHVTPDPVLAVKAFGKEFKKPLGLAAGMDKQGEAVREFLKMGFGFVEVGSVTPEPQPGNDKPRAFRLPRDHGIINRYGFNSDGAEVVFERLSAVRAEEEPLQGLMAVNLGKNKTAEAIPDYVYGVKKFGGLADFLVVNISSPNTPGLRNLQKKSDLQALMQAVVKARNTHCKDVPLLVKIAPDLQDNELQDICDVVLKTKVDGMIVTNTTNQRPEKMQGRHKAETGGLSGLPLRDISTEIIKKTYVMTKGQVPLIGVGGVGTGADAYEKIKAGATLVEMYSRLAFDGPWVVPLITDDLARLLKADGYTSIEQAVGADVKGQISAAPAKKSGWF